MYPREFVYFIVLTVIILSSQILPTGLLLVLDNIAVRIGIVLVLLYLINIGPTAGIFGIMAIASLYLERNRRKVGLAVQKIDLLDSKASPYMTVEEAGQPQKTVPVAEFDVAEPSEVDYLPHESAEGEFEPVAPSINQKAVLSTVYPLQKNGAAAIDELYEQMGFGHI